MADSTPTFVIKARRGWTGLDFSEIWYFRELLGFLIWRDILIRYKQALLGFGWAVVQPVLTMIVFTIVFGKLAGMSSSGAPYAVMTLAAILPWNFFSGALSASSASVVGSANMVRKIYFPRIYIPTSAALSGLLDFGISLIVLVGMMIWFDVPFRLHLFLLPAWFLLAFITALGAGFWFSALNVKYRDVKHIVPFIVRMGIYISPVGFMSSVVPENWRMVYSLNPMVGVIDGFRWAVLGPDFAPYWPGVYASLGTVTILFISGLMFFRRTEKTFADVI
ncbi:MAG: lipopolysaccharide transport system permease protein [Kiritimatiellia bacterium]|jgi:lipopolysaccharide transport system permease protein